MDILAVLAAVLGVPALMGALWYWIARENKRGVRRAAAGGLLGIADEVFRPATHQAHQVPENRTRNPRPRTGPEA